MTMLNEKRSEPKLEDKIGPNTTIQSTLDEIPDEFESVLDHILFHKALISDESDGSRLNRYIELVREMKIGSHIAMSNPYDKSIAITFELIIDEKMDPWDIDLIKFSEQYLKRVEESEELNLITAGRIIFMAWSILKMQSDVVLHNAENIEPEEEPPWEPGGDWYTDDIDFNYTQIIRSHPKPPLQEMVWRKGKRPVTLLELVGAFEEAKKEAEILKILNEKRKLERERNIKLYQSSISQNMHKEDLEADITMIYDRICQFNGHPIKFNDICDSSNEDKITTLVSSLYLAHRRKINIWQREFPYGKIMIENLRDKKGRAPPLPGQPAEDSTFRGLRAKLSAEELAELEEEEEKDNGGNGKDKNRKKVGLTEVVTSKTRIAS